MRKLILISAMVVMSATAQAAPTRGLALASSEEPAAAAPAQEPAKQSAKEAVKEPALEQGKETPKYVERPAAVDTTAQQPVASQSKSVEPKSAESKPVVKAERPKRARLSTEARVIYELHRHGIYW